MEECLWCYGYRSNDDKNEYHHLGEAPQFSLAVRDVYDWAQEHDDYPYHLLYVTEYINGVKKRSLNLEEWGRDGEKIIPKFCQASYCQRLDAFLDLPPTHSS